jgi:hypothetical protein
LIRFVAEHQPHGESSVHDVRDPLGRQPESWIGGWQTQNSRPGKSDKPTPFV